MWGPVHRHTGHSAQVQPLVGAHCRFSSCLTALKLSVLGRQLVLRKNLPANTGNARDLGSVPGLGFSAVIAVAKTSKIMLNSSGESGHTCLVPDFRGNASVFHH